MTSYFLKCLSQALTSKPNFLGIAKSMKGVRHPPYTLCYNNNNVDGIISWNQIYDSCLKINTSVLPLRMFVISALLHHLSFSGSQLHVTGCNYVGRTTLLTSKYVLVFFLLYLNLKNLLQIISEWFYV